MNSKLIVTGHQPNYLPYPGFFEKIIYSDIFIIVDHVQYVKRGPFGWIHRNKIKTYNGPVWLSVPVLSKNNFTQKICEAKINNDFPWARKHWKTISLAYSKSEYFKKYSDDFEEVYFKKWDYLSDLNSELIITLLKLLEIKTAVYRTSKMDYDFQGKNTGVIIDLCNSVGAKNYISGIHGKDYLDLELLKKNDIKVKFQDYRFPIYKQLTEPFIPFMSVIDILFNYGSATKKIITSSEVFL